MNSSAEDSLYHPVVIKQDQRFWKRILIVDDNELLGLYQKGLSGLYCPEDLPAR
jgi:hypothetical protein